MPKKLKNLIASAAVALMALPLPAYAIDAPTGVPGTAEAIVTTVVTFMLGATGAIAIIFLILGGWMYITSGGDKMKLQDAQGKITAAVMGLIIVFVSFLIINQVICIKILKMPGGCIIVPF